jgi:hypothetical protein
MDKEKRVTETVSWILFLAGGGTVSTITKASWSQLYTQSLQWGFCLSFPSCGWMGSKNGKHIHLNLVPKVKKM